MIDIKAQKRELLGKRVKSLRGEGLIPAELYGRDFKNIHLTVPAGDFAKVFREAGESSIVRLKIGEEKDLNVLIHDVSRNPLTDEFLHIDFYQVRMDEKITTSVPIKFIGEAPAVKELEGILVRAMQEIEIEALPADLPQHIDVDISGLTEIGSSIYVKNLNIPKGVKFSVDPATVVATITERVKEEVVETPISIEEVKVEGEEKREKEEEKTEETKEKK